MYKYLRDGGSMRVAGCLEHVWLPPMCATPRLRLPRRQGWCLVGCRRRTRHSLWRPPVPWLLFGSCQIYGCHGVLQHKSTPQLWRPNSSPNLRRRRRRSVASHARKAEGFGGATHAVAGFGCQPNVPYLHRRVESRVRPSGVRIKKHPST
jgi:hypothetical protein